MIGGLLSFSGGLRVPPRVLAAPVISHVFSTQDVSDSTTLTATDAIIDDLLILFSFSNGTGVATLLGTFTNILTQSSAGGGSDCSMRISYKFCTTPGETVAGTGGGMGRCLSVYRGVDKTAPIVAGSSATGTPTPAVVPARSFSPSTWGIAAVAARATSAIDMTIGGAWTRRGHTIVVSNVGSILAADTNGIVASAAAQNVATTGGKWCAASFGLKVAA